MSPCRDVQFNASTPVLSRIVLRRSNQLLEEAEPGWFYIDENTYNNLMTYVSKNFKQRDIKLKDESITAWYYEFMIPDTSAFTNKSTTIEEIYQLFDKLEDFQIRRVAQSIGMGVNFRPSKYVNPGDATTDIVEWAEKNDKLDELKIVIENIATGNR